MRAQITHVQEQLQTVHHIQPQIMAAIETTLPTMVQQQVAAWRMTPGGPTQDPQALAQVTNRVIQVEDAGNQLQQVVRKLSQEMEELKKSNQRQTTFMTQVMKMVSKNHQQMVQGHTQLKVQVDTLQAKCPEVYKQQLADLGGSIQILQQQVKGAETAFANLSLDLTSKQRELSQKCENLVTTQASKPVIINNNLRLPVTSATVPTVNTTTMSQIQQGKEYSHVMIPSPRALSQPMGKPPKASRWGDRYTSIPVPQP